MKALNERYDKAWSEWQRELSAMLVAPGMKVADIGAGKGELTMMMAQQAGPEGHVYAIEIEQDLIDKLRTRSQAEGVANVTAILGEEDDPLFPQGEVDLALMVEVYHHLADPIVVLEATLKRLKPGARLVIIEPDVNQEGGEPDGCYADPDATLEVASTAGFELVSWDRKSIADFEFFVLTVRVPESAS